MRALISCYDKRGLQEFARGLAEVGFELVASGGTADFLEQEVGVDVEELVALGGFGRLRDFGVPEDELRQVAEAVVERAGAKANPRQASVAEVEQLLHNIY